MRVLSAHKKPISSLAFSRDGTRLAEAAHGGAVRIWDLNAGAVVHTFDTAGRFPNQVRVDFAPDGAALAVVNMQVELIDLATGTRTPLPSRPARLSPYNGVCYSPNGRYLAAGGDYFCWWDVATRQSILKPYFPRLEGGSEIDAWRCVAFSPDNARLAAGRTALVYGVVGSVNTVFVHDIAEQKLVGSFGWTGSEPKVVMISPDGRTVAAVCGPILRVWDIDTGNEVAAVKAGKKHFMGAAFAPDGRYVATVSKDRTVRLWDTRTWGEPKTFDWEIGELLAVAFAPDGQTVAVGGSKGKVLLFDMD